MKKLSKSKLKLQLKPWITKGILKSIRYKNKLYKKLCKNNFNDRLKLQQYKTYLNKLTKIKTISKKKCTMRKDFKIVIKILQKPGK